ncbi:oxidoreductase [Lophiostoma macrostomum CBS 122681]|uniref:Oxidoreductase n=1 Tax=Lophiostoma macrostomum CBS 122681 TaxID=1314788 RepID=A0A6A6SQG2_9PLEO|nr:oxidoreductase [Lophiostoma macrostomum CBS 122681]
MTLRGTALVVGGASGIGQETVFAFAEAGCKAVVVADLNNEGAEATSQQSKLYAVNPDYESFNFHVDVANENSVNEMAQNAAQALGGRIDYFVNCAGISNISPFPISDIDTAHFDRVLKVNLYGIINCMKAVSKIMQKQDPIALQASTPRSKRHPTERLSRGSIINLSSVNALVVNSGSTAYSTSKIGVISATKVAALDLAKDHIRVNAVLPGCTDTPMLNAAFEAVPELEQMCIGMTPLGRLASADEIADMIVQLCSPAASYMTGSVVVVDGGMSAMSM